MFIPPVFLRAGMKFPKSAIKTEKELKSILAVMDKFYSPEIADLLKYGRRPENYGRVQRVI